MNFADMAKYLYELGQLKHQKRTGWWRMGVRDPESVAEHSYRAAVIGYILACMEGADPEKTASMCLFHDVAETRISDLSWVAKRYLSFKEGEQIASQEQTRQLPQEIAEKILLLIDTYGDQSLEAQVAHDADLLECLLQAREYELQGYASGARWATMCREGLQTHAARNLADACLLGDPGDWFEHLQDNPRHI